MTTAICPLCEADDFQNFSNRGRDGRPLQTTICRRCGFVWVNPPPDDQHLRNYYAWSYRREAKGTPERTLRQVYRAAQGAAARYTLLAPRLAPGLPVLDVGAGGGELVYLLRKLGVDAQGIEPDETYSNFARRELQVPVVTAFLQDATFPARAFQLVLLFHVLEHVAHPREVLTRLAGWLGPSGAVVIEVPNLDSRCEAPISRFHRDHLSYFTPRTLTLAAARSGLRVADLHLSADGGNIIAIVEQELRAGAITPTGVDPGVATLFSARRAMAFYCSPLPFLRMGERARRYVSSALACRRFSRASDVLDAEVSAVRTAGQAQTATVPEQRA
jgi:2-polyprenyl-3-methyl-5-hydroxy-6-metoxy-1,4-benzoquinol methylase